MLKHGVAKKGSASLAKQLEAVLRALEVLAFETPADLIYGDIRTRLEQAGTPIGGNDMLIAAQVVALGFTLVTDDTTEFARVPGLFHENWLRRVVTRAD
jgi:tRNA(fMet)-specific endonuclease VapC